MPTLLNKIKNRWNASNYEAPSYHIGPITPANHGRWRSRLAKLLGINGTTPLRTASYRPLYQSWFSQPRGLPPFSFETIHSMLMDPGIRLNLAMRAATIYGVQFAYPSGTDASGKTIYQNGVQAANPAVAAWVQRQLNTIWHNDQYCPTSCGAGKKFCLGLLARRTFRASRGEQVSQVRTG